LSIGWAGDPNQIPSEDEFILRSVLETASIEQAAEDKFANTFSVPLGWRLFREEGASPEGWLNHFDYKQFTTENRGFIWVEEPMLRSCLPHLKISMATELQNQSFFRKFILNKTHAKSKDLKCIGMD